MHKNHNKDNEFVKVAFGWNNFDLRREFDE